MGTGQVQHAVGRMYSELLIAARTLESTALMAVEQRQEDWPPPVRKAHCDLAKVAGPG